MSSIHFSTEDLERIKAAVAGAEGQTSGEIVPYYVESSDDYEESVWRGGVLASTLTLLVFYGLRTFTPIWLPFDLTEVLFIILLSAGLGSGLTYWLPPLRRLLAGRALINRRVSARALEAFVSEEVFQTRDRTGILIFLSLFEHRVQIIGDSASMRKSSRASGKTWSRSSPAVSRADAPAKAWCSRSKNAAICYNAKKCIGARTTRTNWPTECAWVSETRLRAYSSRSLRMPFIHGSGDAFADCFFCFARSARSALFIRPRR